MLEGKGFVLKHGVCGGACAVRDNFLEHSCSFMDSHIMFLGTLTFSFLGLFKISADLEEK